jgi:AraC-like DNA-binding protein
MEFFRLIKRRENEKNKVFSLNKYFIYYCSWQKSALNMRQFAGGFLLIAGSIGLLVSVILLFLNKENKQAVKFLAFHLLGVSIHSIHESFFLNSWILITPHILRLSHPILFTLPFTFYFYLRTGLNEKKFAVKKDWYHLLPALIALAAHLPFYFRSAFFKLNLVGKEIEKFAYAPSEIPPEHYCVVLIIALVLVYVYPIILEIKQYNKKAKSRIEKATELKIWIRLIFFFGMIAFTIFLLSLYMASRYVDFYKFSHLVVGIYVLIICISLFLKPYVLYGIEKPDVNENGSNTREVKYAKMNLSDDILTEYKIKIESYLKTCSFIRSGFTLKLMSEELNIPVHHLSYIINKEFGKNFNDFINWLRIDYLVSHYENEKWLNYTIEGIAAEVGFKSKSTFIQAFKKYKGTTPAVFFKKSHKASA